MKKKSMIFLIIVFTMVFQGMNPSLCLAKEVNGDTLIKVPVRFNGTVLPDSLYLILSSEGNQIEVRNFMRLIGGSFYPVSHIFHQDGITVQYGRSISWSRLGFTEGFVELQLVQVEPPVSTRMIQAEHVYFAPLSFLGIATGGTIAYDDIAGRVDITVPPPSEVGSIFPAAKNVALALQDSGYIVSQGQITKEDPIDFCQAGYTPNANGNNVGTPYLGVQLPPTPGTDSIYNVPLVYNFKADEAVIMIGRTPPECIYYSYRSYLENRFYSFPPPGTRTKINASLGEQINPYRMRSDLPLDSMFSRKIAIIVAGDSLVAAHIKNTILASTPEIAPADIYFDIIPSNGMFIFGTDPRADWLNLVHRVSLFRDTSAQSNYVNHPSLEILRVTPVNTPPQNLFTLRSFLSRTCGTNEFDLLPYMELMEEGIYETFHNDYNMIWLKPEPWVIEGFKAIQQGMDALGDNHDCLYLVASEFQFRDKDQVLVYGVDHTRTGQSVYDNVSVYSTKNAAGYGGITNKMMEKSARQFVADTAIADRLFAYLFARHPVQGNPFVYIVPSDTNGTMEGINVDDTAQMATRLYVNTLTKIGPDPMEVVMDQTVLLRPLHSGIEETINDRENPVIKVYPNPVKSKAILEFSVPEWSDVRLTLYNPTGQQVGKTLQINHIRGTVQKELQPSPDLPNGIYIIQGIVTVKDRSARQTLNARMIWTGGNGQ